MIESGKTGRTLLPMNFQSVFGIYRLQSGEEHYRNLDDN